MKISLIVPVFNEEDAIPIFYRVVRNNKQLQKYQVEIIFVNDGSSDRTEVEIKAFIADDPMVMLINFSRNFGKEPALFAGIEHATGDVVIPIDVDLQDPIEIIPKLIEKYDQGADVVLAKRSDRSTDNWLKRKSAQLFYKVHNTISHPKIEENVGDFRLMSRTVVEAIKKMPERQLFMKGLLSWVGFKTQVVEYKRQKRSTGKTKFSGWKLWNLALEGVTSFSTAPLRIWTYIGAVVALVSFVYAAIIIVQKLFYGIEISGYASIMTVILFLGGIQIIGIGILGEYLGRVYMESKKRPRYIISEIIRNNDLDTPCSIKKSTT